MPVDNNTPEEQPVKNNGPVKRIAFFLGEEITVKVNNKTFKGVCMDNYNIDALKSPYQQYIMVTYINDNGSYKEEAISVAFIQK